MEASIVDLRYKMNDILAALERNEEVKVLYRGVLKGTIVPAKKKKTMRASQHPAFGMWKDQTESISETMARLRQERQYDI